MTELRARARTKLVLAAVAVGLLLFVPALVAKGQLDGWHLSDLPGFGMEATTPTVTPRVIEGWAMPNEAGTAISLHETPDDGAGEGFVIAGASWAGPDDVWHDGTELPTCVGTDTDALVPVRLGVVGVVSDEAPSGRKVVWLRCYE